MVIILWDKNIYINTYIDEEIKLQKNRVKIQKIHTLRYICVFQTSDIFYTAAAAYTDVS